MVKTDFLNELEEDQLKEISKKEGLNKVPKNYVKEDYVKFLEGVLTTEKIKTYKKEYFEREVERDIHIHEKVKEKGFKEEKAETTKTSISKHEAIFNLQKEKINKTVYEPIADYLHEPIPTGSGVKFYDNMSDKMRKYVHNIFVDEESDKSGRNFEFRSANWVAYNVKDVVRIETRHKFPGIGEIDIVGYDKYDLPYVVAECKDRPVSFEDIDKWIANSKSIAEEYADKIRRRYGVIELLAFFFGSGGFSQAVVERVKNNPDVNKKNVYIVNRGLFKDSLHIPLAVYDVRNGKYMKILA